MCEKCGTARQVTDGNMIQRMRFAYWLTDARDTHSEYVILFFFSTNIVTRKRLSIRLYVNYLSYSRRYSSNIFKHLLGSKRVMYLIVKERNFSA